MEPLGATASILTILKLAGGIIEYIRAVHGARTEKDRLIDEIKAANDCLRKIRSHIDEENAQEEWLKTVEQACTSSEGPLHLYRIALERLDKKLERASGARAIAKVLTWPFSKAEVQEALCEIERQKLYFLLALQMDNTKLLQLTRTDLAIALELLRSSQPQAAETRRNVKELVQAKRDEDVPKLYSWMSDFPYQDKHLDASNHRLKGSGEWLLELDAYRDWRDNPNGNRLLWCSGIPGAGKTVMTSLIIDDVRSHVGTNGSGVAYFYCSYKQSPVQNAQAIIACILMQFARHKSPLPEPLVELYKKKQNLTERLTIQDLDTIAPLLLSEGQQSVPAFILIDALDECDNIKDRRQLFKFLTIVRPHTKILITSRRGPIDIDRYMETAIQITIEANTTDIRNFLNEEIDGDEEFSDLIDEDLKENVISKIVQSSKGMFLLPALQLKALICKESKTQIRSAIENLPTELGTFFEETLRRIKRSPKSDVAFQALKWVTLTERPLKVDELIHALAIQPEKLEFDRDSKTTDIIIINRCQGLITKDMETSTFRLVHFSLQEHLKDNQEQWFPLGQLSIAKSCIAYLAFEVFHGGRYTRIKDCERDLSEYPLLFYAAQFWGNHWKAAGDPRDHHEAYNFLRNSGSVNHTMQFGYWDDWPFEVRRKLFLLSPSQWSGLHLSALFDLSNTTKKLIDDGIDVAVENEVGKTPLHSACERGSLEAARVLVEMNSDINALFLEERPNNPYNCEMKQYWDSIGLMTPLHLATRKGKHSLVRFLLDNGADLYASTTNDHTALTVAITSTTDISTVRLLIDRGQDLLERQSFGGHTALHLAVRLGQNAVTRLLIEKGADINSRNDQDQTPLMLSAMYGQSDTALLLLSHSADMSIVDTERKNALFYAASSYLDDVVEIMLKKGIEITYTSITPEGIASLCKTAATRKVLMESKEFFNKRDEDGWTALHWICASQTTDEPILPVRYLLEHGADADILTHSGQSPLWFAAMHLWPEVISLLLDKGASVDCRSADGRTILHQAVVVGDEEIVRTILLRQSNTVDGGEDYSELTETPLMTAVSYGHMRIVELLLEADESALLIPNRLGGYPISVACELGRIDIAELLFSKGRMHRDKPLNRGKTLLLIAASCGQLEAVKFLIEHGANINVVDDDNMSVLYQAAFSGNPELVFFLLNKGLDVNTLDKYRSTPLLHAVAYNRVAVVNVLLDHDANIDSKNILHQFPLGSACLNCGPDMISTLIEKGANLKLLTNGRNTVIHQAALAPNAANLATILEQHGIDIEACNTGGDPALHSVLHSNKMIVEKIFHLCDAKCNIDALNRDGQSALHIATELELETAVWALLKKSSNVGLENNDGCTALDVIRDKKKFSMLHENGCLEEIPSREYDTEGQFREKPLDRLRRIISTIRWKRTAVQGSSGAHGVNSSRNQTNKLGSLLDTLVPVLPTEENPLKTKSRKHASLNKFSGVPEHRLKKLRRIERLLSKAFHGSQKKAPETDLISKIEEQGRVDLVAAITSGIDINIQDGDLITPLYAAASAGRYSLVDQCIKLGAKVDLPNCNLDTPLHVAVREGELYIVYRLISRGKANIYSKNRQGNTPLHIAVFARKEHLNMIRLLIGKGAKTDEQNNLGETALHLAISEGLESEANVLLHNVADVNIKTQRGTTALSLAIVKKQESIVRNLFTQTDLDIAAGDVYGFTALHLACLHGSHRTFLELVNRGANVEATAFDSSSCLHLAAQGDQIQAFRFLVQEKNLDPSLPSRRTGSAPLHIACTHGSSEVVLFLLAQGVLVDVRQETPQNLSVGSESSFEDEDEEVEDGRDQSSAKFEREEIDLGDRSTAKVQGMTRGDKEEIRGSGEKTGEALEDHGEVSKEDEVSKFRHEVSKDEDEKTADKDENKEAENRHEKSEDEDEDEEVEDEDKIARSSIGATPLILAAMSDKNDDDTQASICSLLLRRGANINATTKTGETALMHAARLADGFSRVTLLLEKGANANLQNSNGFTALHFAARADGFLTTNYLLKHGADASITDHQGMTPLARARSLKQSYEECRGEDYGYWQDQAETVGEVTWILEKVEKGEQI